MEETETKAKAQKIFLTTLLFFGILSMFAMFFAPKVKAPLFEYYNTGDTSSGTLYGVECDAQTFTVGTSTHTVSLVKLKMYRGGNPGTLLVTIRATNASGHPTGSDLTSGTIDADTFTTNSAGAWYEINLTEYTLTPSTKYAVFCRVPDGTPTDYVRWNIDYIAPTYSDGTLEASHDNGTSWTTWLDRDFMFEIWGSYIGYSYTLYGAYDELGDRDGSINVTAYWLADSSFTFELNGTYSINLTDPVLFRFDLGSNESRTYYIKDPVEDIYVFKPTEPFNIYYVTLVDYVGITNGYLETLITVNGTDRVVERLSVDVTNVMEFTLSWGQLYKFRIVCDQGTYILKTHQAGSETSIVLTISSNIFPPDAIHIGNITVSAARTADITIQILYTDSESLTNWVYVTITIKDETETSYTTNNTGSSQSITWNSALPAEDYIVYVEANHQEEGTLAWQLSCPAPSDYANPWDLDFLGDWPIDSAQIIGITIVACVFAAFSQATAKVGIVATLLVASILVLIGWLNINWAWMATVWCIGILVVLSLVRTKGER